VAQRTKGRLVDGRLEAPARFEEVPYLRCRAVAGAGEQQPVASRRAVSAVIIEEAERDLLVVRVVADARGDEGEAADERRRVGAAREIGGGPGDARRPVERGDRRLGAIEDLSAGQALGIARQAPLDPLQIAGARLMPGFWLRKEAAT